MNNIVSFITQYKWSRSCFSCHFYNPRKILYIHNRHFINIWQYNDCVSEIIEKVKAPPPLIRPSVSKGAAPPEVINIMRQCWAEQADMRPDFNAVHDLFKKLNHGRKVNIVDTMFQMLEKYSNNLEELIRERTEQLDFEKKKTEQLLNRMLPR